MTDIDALASKLEMAVAYDAPVLRKLCAEAAAVIRDLLAERDARNNIEGVAQSVAKQIGGEFVFLGENVRY